MWPEPGMRVISELVKSNQIKISLLGSQAPPILRGIPKTKNRSFGGFQIAGNGRRLPRVSPAPLTMHHIPSFVHSDADVSVQWLNNHILIHPNLCIWAHHPSNFTRSSLPISLPLVFLVFRSLSCFSCLDLSLSLHILHIN